MMLPTIQSVSVKGQLVIPKAIRDALTIESGTRVTMVVDLSARLLKIQPVATDPIKAAIGSIRPKTGKSHLTRLLKQKYADLALEK